MQTPLKTGTIVTSLDGLHYRVLEVTENCVSLITINGQTIFSYRPDYAAAVFSLATLPTPPSQAIRNYQ